jgi:UDP-xylose/UDP-N-acetylglucosamine transporter B4
MTLPLAAYTLFASCTLNSLTMEAVVRAEPRCGVAMTFWQFLTICVGTGVLICLRRMFVFEVRPLPPPPPGSWRARAMERPIPMRSHVLMGLLFFASSTLNNVVFQYGVSVPLHMLVRSASIATTLLLNYVIRRRTCSWRRLWSAALVSVGMLFCIDWRHDPDQGLLSGPLMGNALLVVSLFLSSGLGIMQEHNAEQYGNDNALECMFFMHLVAMPLFLVFAPGSIFGFGTNWPSLTPPALFGNSKTLSMFALNTALHFCCTFSGFQLFNRRGGALSGTLLITLRKGVSLLLSTLLFGTRIGPRHLVGAAALAYGTINYFN